MIVRPEWILATSLLLAGCSNNGTCEFRYDQASADNSIPNGLEVCVDGWQSDKCSAGALSGATQGLATSGFTFTKGAACTQRGFKECSAGRGTYYKKCPDEFADPNPLEHAYKSAGGTEPTSLTAAIPVPEDAPFLGAPDGKVVLQVFGDYGDPFSGRQWPALKDALKKYTDLKIVFRHHPLAAHKDARLAHQAAAEAFTQKGNAGFWAMNDLIAADSHRLDRATLIGYATTIGLDVAAFTKALDSGAQLARVARDVKVAEDLGISSAPVSIVDTRLARGQLTPDRIEALLSAHP